MPTKTNTKTYTHETIAYENWTITIETEYTIPINLSYQSRLVIGGDSSST